MMSASQGVLESFAMDSIPCTSDSITHFRRSIPVAFEASNEEHNTREMMVRGSYEHFNHGNASRVSLSSEEVSTPSRAFQTQLHESQFQLSKMQESCIFKEQLIQRSKTELDQLGLELKSPVIQNPIETKTGGSSKENNPMQLQSNKDISEAKSPDQILKLIQQNRELELANRTLIDEKCILEAKCCQLMEELSQLGSASEASTRNATELRETNRRLEAEKQELHVEVIQAIAENKSLSHQMNGVEDVIELQKGRIRDLEASRDSFALRCEELRSELILQEQSTITMNSKLEEQCSIVKKLVSNLHLCKDQICDRKVTISQQEERISSLCKKLKEIRNSKSQIELRCQELQEENKTHISEVQDLKTNLMKSTKQLNENDRKISLLIEQMSESKKSSASRSRVFSYSFCKASFLNRKNHAPISASSRSVLEQHVKN